jgi:hypothetical protein
MSNTVPAAATGLPKISRRNVVSAFAASAAVVAPVMVSAAENPDACLLSLFEEWKRVKALQEAALAAADEANDVIAEFERTMPEAAKFKNRPLGRGYNTPSDHQWVQLEQLTEGGRDGMRHFDDDAYDMMRRATAHNEWYQDAEQWTCEQDGWIAPYAPALKARVAEILAAYDPWNAERQRLKAEWTYDAKRDAAHHATVDLDKVERAIAGTRATTEAGWRLKSAIVLNVWTSVNQKREEFLKELADPDRDTINLIEQSLVFDLFPEAQV